MWISNPDGSLLTQLSTSEFHGDLFSAVSPAGNRLALVVSNGQGLDLLLVQLPGGQTQKVTHLISQTPQEATDATSAKSFAVYAIRDYNGLAWQPGDGRYLAFTGAVNGPTSDLYVSILRPARSPSSPTAPPRPCFLPGRQTGSISSISASPGCRPSAERSLAPTAWTACGPCTSPTAS